jgi:hypothetical protein
MRGILIQTLEMVDPLSLASVPAQGARESPAPVRRGKGPLDLFLFPPHRSERGLNQGFPNESGTSCEPASSNFEGLRSETGYAIADEHG